MQEFRGPSNTLLSICLLLHHTGWQSVECVTTSPLSVLQPEHNSWQLFPPSTTVGSSSRQEFGTHVVILGAAGCPKRPHTARL